MHSVLLNRVCVAVFVLALAACAKPSRVDNPVVRGIHYVGVSVSDIDASTELYQNTFDLQLVGNGSFDGEPAIDALAGREGVQASTRVLKSVNGQLRLMQFISPSEAAQNAARFEVQGPGFAHVCMQVNQATQAYQKFLDGGAEYIGSAEMVQITPKNPVYYAYARDKDEVIFEIEHVDVAKLNLPEPPKNKYRMRHIAIATPDIERTIDFYSMLFETKNPRRVGRFFPLSAERLDGISGLPGSKVKMAFFQVRNMEFEVAQYLSHPTEAPEQTRPLEALGYNMVMFDVTSLVEAKELLVGAGGSVELESMEIDGAEVMFGRDLDGNLLGFQTLSKDSPLSAQNFKDNGAG